MRIIDILQAKNPALSYEFFTPKTDEGRKNLLANARLLAEKTRPDFVSLTYGAGGSTRTLTTALVTELQDMLGIPVMHHLTCIGQGRVALQGMIAALAEAGVDNILALRGDPPSGSDTWTPHPEGCVYASELIALIRLRYPECSIAAAGFPEGHPESGDPERDAERMKHKIRAGAEFLITQLFFETQLYTGYRERLARHGITVPILPGILPITHYQNLLKFTAGCKASVPQAVHDIFAPIAADEAATRREGIAWAVRQARELLDEGTPGLHFYTLNKAEPVLSIVKALQL
ncbi:MAG: methylenetetrahydrofolate reductase [Spirochaetota bacterium]|jgi:methylenetetrahydrofolate reductase (NADPH)|nr:methylenetetrahydrofolate reductase [Spirochaetota bacterium]